MEKGRNIQTGICRILCHPETNAVVALRINEEQRLIFQEHSWQKGESLKKINFNLSDGKALRFFLPIILDCVLIEIPS